MQIDDIESLCNNAMKTGYSKAIADALKEVIDVLKLFENDAMCRVCLTEAGDRIASLGFEKEGE